MKTDLDPSHVSQLLLNSEPANVHIAEAILRGYPEIISQIRPALEVYLAFNPTPNKIEKLTKKTFKDYSLDKNPVYVLYLAKHNKLSLNEHLELVKAFVDKHAQLYEELINLNPARSEYYIFLADWLKANAKDHDLVIRCFQKALKYNPKCPRTSYNFSKYLVDSYDLLLPYYTEAVLNKWIVEYAKHSYQLRYDVAVFTNLATFYEEIKKDIPKATATYQKCIDSHLHGPESLLSFAEFLIRQKQYELAQKHLVTATSMMQSTNDANIVQAYVMMATVYWKHYEDYEKAILYIQRALCIDSSYSGAISEAIQMYKMNGDQKNLLKWQKKQAQQKKAALH